jgi:hypothetical protein
MSERSGYEPIPVRLPRRVRGNELADVVTKVMKEYATEHKGKVDSRSKYDKFYEPGSARVVKREIMRASTLTIPYGKYTNLQFDTNVNFYVGDSSLDREYTGLRLLVRKLPNKRANKYKWLSALGMTAGYLTVFFNPVVDGLLKLLSAIMLVTLTPAWVPAAVDVMLSDNPHLRSHNYGKYKKFIDEFVTKLYNHLA